MFQCSEPCRQVTYDNAAAIRRMVAEQRDMRIPAELVPKCPMCGRPLTMNLRSDAKFVEDEGWRQAAERYSHFLRTRRNKRVLFLELGVGYNTPVIIKYPFWQMTAENNRAMYACVNFGEAFCPHELQERAVCVSGDIGEVLEQFLDSDS